MKVSRRQLVRAGIGVAVPTSIAAYATWVEPAWLEVTRHVVPIASLPAGLAGARVAQLTDIHLSRLGTLHYQIARALRAEAPKYCVLTGDIIDAEAKLPILAEFLELLRSSAPMHTFAILGNWERWGRVPAEALRGTYGQGGAKLLVNEGAYCEGLSFRGTDDALSGHADFGRGLSDEAGPGPRIVLTHSPEILDTHAGPLSDLVLAGHTHGGQIGRPPVVVTPPGSGRFVSGWYETAMGRVYVSRGVGTSIVPARLLRRPELAIFTLERG